jgi:hypothetical protein
VDLAELGPGVQPVADLGTEHDTHGRVDRVTFAEAAGAQRHAGEADLLGPDAGEEPRPIRDDRFADRCAWEDPLGVLDDARIAALGGDHRAEPLQGGAAVDRFGRPCEGVVVRNVLGELQGARGEQQRELPEPAAAAPPEDIDRLGDVEGVAHGVAEGLRHVGDGGARPPTPAGGKRQARLRQFPRVLRRLHERSGSGLHVEEDQVGLDGELLRHHARGDQRHRRDRGRRVAQRVQCAVGRDQVRRLRSHRASHRLDLRPDLLRGEIRAQPGDRLELVEGPAGVPQASSGELGDGQSERRRHRREDQGDPVGYPAGRVLVDRGTVQARERDRVPGPDHRPGEREGLLGVQATEQRRHQERRGQRIRGPTPAVTLHEGPDLRVREFAAVALGRDDLSEILDRQRRPRGPLWDRMTSTFRRP